MSRYILDTNIFNRIYDDSTQCLYFEGLELVGTYVQKMELEKAPDIAKRARLLEIFSDFTPDTELPYTTHWGDRWGSRWSDDGGLYEEILVEIRKLDGKKRKGNNQERDAQIAEVTIKSNLTLISDDTRLRVVVVEFGGNAISLSELEILGMRGREHSR